MSQYSSVFGDVDWVSYYKKRKPDLTEIKDGINDIKQSIANLECGGSGGSSGGSNTYAHKVEIKFDNFSLSYYGQEGNHNIFGLNFDNIANNSIGRNDISVSGDLQEILNFYPIMLSPYSKEFKTACHVYLKDADTENLVEGVGICGSSSEGSRKVGIIFNSGTQDKYFTNTIVLEWGLEVQSGGGSSQTTSHELSVTANGTYDAGNNAAYNPVTVNVPSGGGGATTTKKLNAKEIRTSVESEQAITPPEGYDGFSEITFTPGLLSEVIVTKNQTMEFGTDDVPYFPKKLTVSTPSPTNYTLETLSLNKNSAPVTISYADKVFVFLGKIETWGELVGIGGTADKLLYEKSVTIKDGGATAGTVSIDPDAKTITYTPNTSYNMGSVRITKLII